MAIKRRELSESTHPYEKLAWYMFLYITGQSWFEAFVMINILFIGIATGIDLQYGDGPYPTAHNFVNFVSMFTTIVFTIEVAFKLIAEGLHPQTYFTDEDNGAFNTFDFSIVAAGYALMSGNNGATVGALRMMRLVRLLTFIKGVKQLRVIVSGLITGLKSVSYIVILLVLVIYIHSILACLFFGGNDPARFGSVAMAMLSLFQISTTASWTSIVYTTWFGCENYLGDPYNSPESHTNPSMIRTWAGTFEGFRCDAPSEAREEITALFFFTIYIILTAWVIMSLFIGVITMGMFEAFNAMKEEDKARRYQEKVAENSRKSTEETPLGKLVIAAISDDAKIEREVTPNMQKFEEAVRWCKSTSEATWFTSMITTTIIVVGIFIGVELDQLLSCERYFDRDNRPDHVERCEVMLFSTILTYLSQIIFTFELVVKILSEGYEPKRYFNDGWNCMDSFIVLVGFIEMTPLAFIFEVFPVVILRLLRLLRVFRLAKALPKLRAIVEALMQGFSAVGWICVLIIVFNYIIACMSMLVWGSNDPFHFGTVPRAVFNVLRIETLDSWDQILYIAMYGCAEYPGGYPFTVKSEYFDVLKLDCKHSEGSGWFGALMMLIIVIFGAFVLPTVLIGIVAISYDEATRKAANVQEMMSKLPMVVKEAEKLFPGFLSRSRQEKLRKCFSAMDADDELSLDINEMTPFFEKVFKTVFDVELSSDQMLSLFHIMDTDGSTELGFAEFGLFVVVIKKIDMQCRKDAAFCRRIFKGTKNKYFTQAEEELKKSMEPVGSPRVADAETKEEQNQAENDIIMDRLVSNTAATVVSNVPVAPVDPYAEADCPRTRPEPDNSRTLRQVIERTCEAIASRFLGPCSSIYERSGLADILFQSVTSELLLAKHTDEPIFGPQPSPWELEALVERAISIAITKQEQAADEALEALVAEPQSSSSLDWSKTKAPAPLALPAVESAGPQAYASYSTAPPAVRRPSPLPPLQLSPGPPRAPKAAPLAVQKPTMRPRTPNKPAAVGGGVEIGGGVGDGGPRSGRRAREAALQSQPRRPSVTKSSSFEDRFQERRAATKREKERRVSTESSGPNGGSSSSSSGGGGGGGGVPWPPAASPDSAADAAAAVAVAWRRVLLFLQKDTSMALAVEALFDGQDADGAGALSVVTLARNLLALGANLTARQTAAFREDIDLQGSGKVTLDEFLDTVQARSLMVTSGLSAVWDRLWQHLAATGGTLEGMFAGMAERHGGQGLGQGQSQGQGRLRVASVAAGLEALGVVLSAQQKALFADSLDANGDGHIDLAELARVARLNRAALKGKQPPVAAAAAGSGGGGSGGGGGGGGGGDGALEAADAASSTGGGSSTGSGGGDSARAWRLVLARLASSAAFAQMVEDLFDAAEDAALGSGGGGGLGIGELIAALQRGGVMLAPPDVRAFFADCDVNGDGFLSLDEFLRAVKKNQDALTLAPAGPKATL